jgi:predicted nuclease with TOPRIM domain
MTTSDASILNQKLKVAEPEVRTYVKHLEAENKKLQTKYVKLESKYYTDKNRIFALEKELKKGHVHVTIKR